MKNYLRVTYVSPKFKMSMSIIVILIVSGFFVQKHITQPKTGENLFKNGNFNEGLASPAYWWTYSSGNGTVFTWQESGGMNNSRYIRIDKSTTPNGGAWAQGIEPNGNMADYRATGWVKGEFTNMGPDGGFYICVECWSKNWTYLGGLDSMHITTNVSEWTLTSVEGYLFTDTYHITVTLNIRDCTGWVGWDNATFDFV